MPVIGVEGQSCRNRYSGDDGLVESAIAMDLHEASDGMTGYAGVAASLCKPWGAAGVNLKWKETALTLENGQEDSPKRLLLCRKFAVPAHSFSFNITPRVRFGEENRIEMVGNGAGEKSVQLVEIRYHDKGVYP